MVRATTGGVMKSYRYNLMNSFIRDNKARDTVLSQRVFNSYAEDPASAAKAFRLRKSRMMADNQLDVCSNTYHKYQAAFSCLQTIDEFIDTENGGTTTTTLKRTTLEMLNDPTGDARTQLTKVLNELGDSIVQNMNQTYGDDFIFAGADGQNVPFEVKTENGKNRLYYRGVPVDAAEPKLLTDNSTPPQALKVNANGEIDAAGDDYLSADAELVEVPQLINDSVGGQVMVDNSGAVDPAGTNYLLAGTPTLTKAEYDAAITGGEEAASFSSYTDDQGTDRYFRKADAVTMSQTDYTDTVNSAMVDTTNAPYTLTKDGKDYYIVKNDESVITKEDYDEACLDAEKLDYLVNEKRFVDIGLGFKEDENGKLIESSAFNDALNGLTFLGCGLDEDGDPKNIYSLVQRLKEVADAVPDGQMWDDATYNEFKRLVGKLEDASSKYKTEFTNMDAGTQKLENNETLLKEKIYNLKVEYSELEDVNMADAISSFIWAEYCYNAALKVGNSILSQSLMDYLQ